MNYINIIVCVAIVVCCIKNDACAYSSSSNSISVYKAELTSSRDTNSATEYVLSFSQFTPAQVAQMQSFMRLYSQYVSMQVIKQNSVDTQMLYVYGASKALLINNLQKTSDHLGFEVLLRNVDNKIDIKFIQLQAKSLPYKEW